MDAAVNNSEIIKNRLIINNSQDKNKIDLVLTYTDNYSSTIVPYVNTGLTESGPHITQIKTALTRVFNDYGKKFNILNFSIYRTSKSIILK